MDEKKEGGLELVWGGGNSALARTCFHAAASMVFMIHLFKGLTFSLCILSVCLDNSGLV